MKIKYFLMIYLLIGITFLSFSQKHNSSFDLRLLTKYSSEYLEKLQAENPDNFNYLNYVIDNSYYFTNSPNEKPTATQVLVRVDPQTKKETEISSFDNIEINFNPYLYNCEIGSQDQKCFSLGNTGKILVMRSKASLDLRYRSYKTKQNQINNK